MTTTFVLDEQRVNAIFLDCLFKDGESRDIYIYGEAVIFQAGFHPDRLYGYFDEILEMLNELPDTFRTPPGDSFLRMCLDRRGKLWTGDHKIVDQLCALGSAIGAIAYTFPKEKWELLPGGVPVVAIT
jgi:hypothetical protein